MEGSIWHGVIGTGIRESHGGIVLVHAGNYVMIEERVTVCSSISIVEDTVVTRTLGQEGATHSLGWKWGGF